MVKDPVCGMEVDPNTSEKWEYQGQTYYFCSPDCKESFEKSPDRYIHAQMGGSRGMGSGGSQTGGE